MSESLLQMHALRDFIELLIWTGQLSDERPSSAILIAPPGAGKTTLLESLFCPQAIFVGDITARTVAGLVKDQKEMTHILLGDMLSMFGHKGGTVKLTMRLVSQMTGEKLMHNPWTGEEIEPRQIGMITAIPPEDYKKMERTIKSGGFASRFLLMKYTYRASTVNAIHNFIAANGYATKKPEKMLTIDNKGKLTVKIAKRLSDQIKDFGNQLKKDPLGFRAHRHVRALVKADARRKRQNEATHTNFKLVQGYCEFFTSEGKAI